MADWLNVTFYGLDRAVMLAVNGLRDSILGGFLNFISVLFAFLGKGGLAFIFAGVVLLLFKNTRKAGLAVLLAVGIGALFTNLILKPCVQRPRPYVASEEFNAIWKEAGAHAEKEYSFPSGHTNVAMTAMTALFLCFNKKWSWSFFFVVIVMGFSRMYLAVHYFTDVLGGIIVGGLSGILAYHLTNYLYKLIEKNQEKTFCKFYLEFDLIKLIKKDKEKEK